MLVSFSAATGQERLSSSVEVIGNYQLVSSSGASVAITRAELADNGYDVILTTATALIEGTRYTLTVSNVRRELGAVLASAKVIPCTTRQPSPVSLAVTSTIRR
ncbi:MAG: hypothetical protein R3F38_16755 [Gammaproteobacteria bacterium]